MSKSWLALIIFGVAIFVVYTGFQLFRSFSGATVATKYAVDQITPEFGEETLTFLNSKQDEILVHEEDI